MVEICKFEPDYLSDLASLIHSTITECYPSIYAREVVEFFVSYHSEQEILRRAAQGHTFLLFDNSLLVATAFLYHSELGGLYVRPNCQRKGYGKLLMDHLLSLAATMGLQKVWLDATPLAKPLYDKLGFTTLENACQMVGSSRLDYYKMEKILRV